MEFRKLEDIVSIKYGYPFDSRLFGKNGPVRVVRIRDIKGISDPTFYNGEYESEYAVDDGDILVGMDGEFNCTVWNAGKAILNQRMAKIIPRTEVVDKFYLFYLLKMRLKVLESQITGSTVKHLLDTHLRAAQIPFPSMPTQRRIGLILRKAEILATKREQGNHLTNGIIRSIFLKTFGNPNEAQSKFPQKLLADLVENLDSRRVPLNEEQRSERNGDVPYYGASGLVDWIDDFLFNEPLLLVAEDGENLRSRKLPIAYSIDGKSWVNNHAHVFRCVAINQRFLESWLNLLDISQFLGGSTRPKMNKSTLMAIEVPVPPDDLQVNFHKLIEKMHRLRDRQVKSTQETTELFHSLLRKAFRGELAQTG